MKDFILISIFVCLIIIQSTNCHGGSDEKKQNYELQERCGETAGIWASKHSEVIDYTAQYNSRLNKCIVLAKLSSLVSGDTTTNYEMLYEPNSNKILGQYTVRLSPTNEDYICIIDGVNYGKKSKEKWKSFIREMMGE
jgi:hypothetical protein